MKLFLLAILLLSSTFLVAQNDSTKKWTFSGYGEIYYSYDFTNPENHQTIISTNSSNGFQVSGVSSNVDYSINKRVLCRVEGKMYDSKGPIFKNNKNNNYSLTTNVTIKF